MQNITIKEFESMLILEKLDPLGHLMSLKNFIDCVDSGGFIDYDGFGYLVYKGKQVRNSNTCCDEESIEIGNHSFYMKDLLKFDNSLQVNWYNR